MEITLYNIREKIFLNSDLQKKLSFFKTIFDEWNFANILGGMSSKQRYLEIELLNALEEDHIFILSQYFSSEIKIKKIENNLSKNYKFSINCEELPKEIREYREFCISVNKENLYLTFWR